MEKTRKRILYAAMVAVLVVLQLSNALIALADSKTPLKVSDVGDANLYALLAAATDSGGNNGGILYKEDAENLTSLNLGTSNLYDTVGKVESFENLAAICPNIKYIYDRYSNVATGAKDSLISELAKLEKLTDIEVGINTQKQLTTILNMVNRENAVRMYLELRNSSETYDVNEVSGFTNLTELSINNSYNGIEVKGIESVNKLGKLTSLSIDGNYGEKFQSIINNVPDSLDYLYLYNSVSSSSEISTEVSIDVSGLTKTERLTLGGFDSIAGLEKIASDVNNEYYYSDTYINIYGNSKTKIKYNNVAANGNIRRLELHSCILEDVTSIDKVPANAYDIEINNCGVTDVKISDAGKIRYLELNDNDIRNITNLDAEQLYSLYMNGNKLSAVPDIKTPNLNRLELNNNGIADVTSIKNYKEMTYISLKNNKITDISGLKELKNLREVYLNYNKITDISALADKSNLDSLNVTYNDIESIPDLSGISSLVGGRYSYGNNYNGYRFDTDYYKLSLAGNKLTKDAIKGKVPEGCENDIYWMYMSITRSTDSNSLYYTELDSTLISKYIEVGRNYIRTSQKEYTLDEELVKYLKDRSNDEYSYRLHIEYVDGNSIADEVVIDPKELTDDTKTIDIKFDSLEKGSSTKELDEAFSQYGQVEKYYVARGSKDSGIAGVSYDSYYSTNITFDNKDEYYHEYLYDPDTKTFEFYDYLSGSSNPGINTNDKTKGMIYFFVPDSKDSLVNTHRVEYDNGNGNKWYSTYNAYTQLNDDVINGIMLRNKVYGNYYSSKTIESESNINISKENVSKLIENKTNININAFDAKTNSVNLSANVNYSNLKEQDIKTKLPAVTRKDGSELHVPFAGGQPDYVYDIDNTADNYGIAYSLRINTEGSGYNTYGANLYKVVGQSYVPVMLNTWNAQKSIKNGVKEQYFVISAEKDEYMKTKVVSEGEYEGRKFNYLNKADSNEIKKLYNAKKENGDSNVDINIIVDKVELDDELIQTIKNNESSYYGRQLSINFLNVNNGINEGYAHITASNLRNVTAGPVTIEKPEVEVSTYNENFNKYKNQIGSDVIYIRNKSNVVKGVRYGVNGSIINNILQRDFFAAYTPYYGFNIVNDKLVKTTSGQGIIVPVNSEYIAYVLASNYATPTDTTPSDTTPSDVPTEPAPTEPATPAPTEPATPAPTEPTTPDNGNTTGENVPAQIIDKADIIDVASVNDNLIENITDSALAEIKVTSSSAPKLTSNVFSQMKDKEKDITVGVTDENNRLQYQWKFDCDTVTQTDMDIDLSISFDTDRAEAVKDITGRDDLLYLSFAHHGALPGPATIKTYVGNKYKDGDIVYLYYYNEEKNRVESVGDVNKGLIVKNGYVEYTITHCSVYFLSQAMAADVKAVEPEEETQGSEVVAIPDSVNDTVPTGDAGNVTVYAIETIVALAVAGGLVFSRRKKRA